MMRSKNNGFTASDIERYHSGKMLPEERHALEKAALDDPFLADALEGYAFTSTTADDIAKIQSRLDEKLGRKKVVSIFQKYKWLSAAAIVLIIAGSGWLVYDISQESNNTSVTALEKKLPDKDSNAIVPSSQNNLPDSVNGKVNSAKGKPAEQNQQATTINIKNQTNERSVSLKSKKQTNQSNDKKIIVINNADIVSKAVSTPSQNEVASASNWSGNNQRGYAKMNNAVAMEPRSNNVMDTSLFSKKAENNMRELTGRISGIAENDTIKNLNIVLKSLPTDSLKEVVIVGYGTQKKSTEKYPHVIIDTLEPEQGYVHFDDYVANNLKMPQEIKDKTVSGEVQLSFDVDKNGQPTNISVVKSLCEKCDEEAIRLLKEGPKWKKKKNKKGIITIRF